MGVNQNYRITTDTHCLFFCLQYDDFVEIARTHKFLRKDYKILRVGEYDWTWEMISSFITTYLHNTLKQQKICIIHHNTYFINSFTGGKSI